MVVRVSRKQYLKQYGIRYRKHVNNGGAEDRLHRGISGVYRYLYRLIQNGEELPDIYKVECYNCNAGGYSNNGICPHKNPLILERVSKARRMHKDIIIKYGGMCSKCNETELGFLTVDHIDGGGSKEVQETFRGQTARFYRHLRDDPIRNDIEILCWNCNCSKR